MMEDKFKKAQEIWKNQKINTNVKTENIADDFLINKLKKFEKKQNLINLVKMTALVIILAQFIYLLFDRLINSVYMLAGVSLIITSTIVFAVLYLTQQFNVKKLDLEKSLKVFVDQAIEALNKHLIFFEKYFLIFGVVLITSLNLMYYELFNEVSFGSRILYHSAGSVFVLFAFIFGMTVRRRRHKNEYLPLINELKEIKNDLEGGEDE